MIYLDSCALLKFIRREKETDALRTWRMTLPRGTELVSSELARLEITRPLLRVGVEPQRVPGLVKEALRGIYLVDLTSAVLARAIAYHVPRLGSLDSIHLASAEPFRPELTDFVTYDQELSHAAADLGFPTTSPQ